jgi:Uma2 family endonuclease
MSTAKPRSLLRIEYADAAEAYLRSLPPEHFMESTTQATQRKISVVSFDLIQLRRPEVQMFSELLVQYTLPRRTKIQQVVPDNMVIIHHEPIRAKGSYDIPLQPARPFMMMEYVSKESRRKDHEDSFRKYERELKVKYYLLYYPDEQELSLYRLSARKYVSVKPNAASRYAIPELELELGLLDGWVRFWFRGELLPLPADLQRKLDEKAHQVERLQAQMGEERRKKEEERRKKEEDRQQKEEERRQKEKLIAQLQAMGIDPQL